MLKQTSVAVALALMLSACNSSEEPATQAQKVNTPTTTNQEPVVAPTLSESEKVNAFFERVFEESIARSPESLTFLGRKERADEWNDLSKAHADESLEITKRQLTELKAFDKTIDENFKNWIFKQNAGKHNRFTNEQMDWLRMIKDHVVSSYHIELDDLDYTPFDSQGGRGKMFQLFGNEMNDIINELNEVLAA